MTEIRNSVLAGLVFGLVMGLYVSAFNGVANGLLVGAVCGIVVGGVLYLFITSKTVQQQTSIENDGQKIIYSGAANHMLNREAVGGKLYLLPDRLQFKSHNFNVQNHEQSIPLNQIKDIGLYNSLGIVPNGLTVTMLDGKIEKFVVNDRQLWKNEINKTM